MGQVVEMLDEFLRTLEADQKELATRFDEGKLLAGLGGAQAEAEKGMQRMFKELDEVRERVVAMRANAAELETRIGAPRAARQRQPEPVEPPPAGWAPGDSPLSDTEVAAAAERLVQRLRAAPPLPHVSAAGSDVAAIPSGSWETPAPDRPTPSVESSQRFPIKDKPPAKKRRGDDVSDMESGAFKP